MTQKSFPLTARMSSVRALDGSHLARVEAMHGRHEEFRAGTELPTHSRFASKAWTIVSGWLMRTRVLRDGRRQILGYVLPGDLVNVTRDTHMPLFYELECATDVVVADVSDLRQHAAMAEDGDPITEALWTLLAHDDAMALNTIARLTRQSAYERLAHQFLDIHHRLSLTGQVEGAAFTMPLTQQMLGDALGLSVVHVNRVFMQLRREGLVERQKHRLTLLDVERLAHRVDHTVPAYAPPDGRRERALARHPNLAAVG